MSIFTFDKKWTLSSTFLWEKTIAAELPGDNYHALWGCLEWR
jgi:hypothetical protein